MEGRKDAYQRRQVGLMGLGEGVLLSPFFREKEKCFFRSMTFGCSLSPFGALFARGLQSSE